MNIHENPAVHWLVICKQTEQAGHGATGRVRTQGRLRITVQGHLTLLITPGPSMGIFKYYILLNVVYVV